jgi:hypothetical protein
VTETGGVPDTSPRRGRGPRALVIALLVLSFGSVLALVLLPYWSPQPLDALAVRDRVLDLDRRAEAAYIQAGVDAIVMSGERSGPAFGERMATRLERSVLPLVREARRTALAIEPPDRYRRLVDLLQSFTAAREAEYVALLDAVRTAGIEATVAAKTRQAEGDRLRAEIEALGGR